LSKKLEHAENHVEDLKARVNQMLNEKKKIEDMVSELNHENQALSKQLSTAQSQLEAEVLLRVNLENQLHSLKEEMAFKENLHKQEVVEIRATHTQQYEQAVEEHLKEQYEQRLADELQELREHSEAQVKLNRDELQKSYEGQLKDLQKRFDSKMSSETNMRNEVQAYKSKAESMTSKITELQSLSDSLSNRVKDMERMIEQERSWTAVALKDKDDEMSRLRAEISQIHKEYQDLMDVKIALDLEINTYRKLLDGEETRLSLSPRVTNEEGTISSRVISSPRAYATPRKRKRAVVHDEENVIDIKVFSDSKGDLEINDYDQEGKYVKLYNKGDEDLSLSGWQLTTKCGDKVVVHKFHRTTVIKSKGTITVWSSDSKATHNPPSEILMKSNWCTGDDVSITLVNTDGEVKLS